MSRLASPGSAPSALAGLVLAATLLSCGGGGDDSAAPATPTVTVRGAAYGLVGRGLSVALDGGAAVAVASDGTFAFPGARVADTTATVTIARQPALPAQVCTVAAPQTIDAGAAVFVRIDCATSTQPLTGTLSMQRLTLAWPELAGATTYHVQRQVAGGAWIDDGPALAAPATRASRELSAHLVDWATTRYRVRGCAGPACSTTHPLALLDLAAAAGGYLKASNPEAGDGFGSSIALSADGSTLAVGAPGEDGAVGGIDGDPTRDTRGDAGAVYVFRRDGTGWTRQAYVKAPVPQANARFGEAIALSRDGGVLAVGAPGHDTGAASVPTDPTGTPHAGAVHVYIRDPSGAWSAPATLTASNAGPQDAFGASVSLSDDGATLAVGAPGEDGPSTASPGLDTVSASGAAYVFGRTAGTWSQQAYLKARTPKAGNGFGHAVALSGNGTTLAIAAPFDGSNATGVNGNDANASLSGSGSVTVFIRSGPAWTRQAYLKSPVVGADRFGRSIAISRDGNLLAVGAPDEDGRSTGVTGSPADRGAVDSGAVHVFVRIGLGWGQQAYLKAGETFAGDAFGSSVALSADGAELAVGAIRDDGGATGIGDPRSRGRPESGGVTVYTLAGSTWSVRNYVKAPNAGPSDGFGRSVALSGDGTTLAVGAPGEDGAGTDTTADPASDGAAQAGAAYMY